MKTTLDLPEDLVRAVKMRAVQENKKLKDEVADLLRRGLAQKRAVSATGRKSVELPLIECAHEARAGAEMIPDRVAEALLDEEAVVHRTA